MSLSISGLLERGKTVFPTFFQKKNTTPQITRRVGLNIGRSNLAACEVSMENGQLTMERVVHKAYAPESSPVEQLKQFWKDGKFDSKRVIASIKGRGVVIRFLNFPKMTPADFASAIQFEAEKYLPFSLSEVVFDYYLVPGERAGEAPKTTMQVILAAARRVEVMKLVETVKAAGLELAAIDVDTFAGTNAFEHACPGESAHSVGLIDFGARDTTISILDKGHLEFSRDIAFGGEDMTDLISRKFNIDREAALKIQSESDFTNEAEKAIIPETLSRLLHELKLSINYYYNQRENAAQLETLFISGGFSKLKILPQMLENQLALPVKFWDPAEGFTKGPGINTEELKTLTPYLPVSIGLTLRPQ